jgi:hypothetical protein
MNTGGARSRAGELGCGAAHSRAADAGETPEDQDSRAIVALGHAKPRWRNLAGLFCGRRSGTNSAAFDSLSERRGESHVTVFIPSSHRPSAEGFFDGLSPAMTENDMIINC